MVTYRFTIYTDSVRETRIGAATRASTMQTQRDSKAMHATVLVAFRGALAEVVPDGTNARAWLEISEPKMPPRTIERWKRGEEPKRDRQGNAVSGSWVNDKGAKVAAGEAKR